MFSDKVVFWAALALNIGLVTVFLYGLLRSLLPRIRRSASKDQVQNEPEKQTEPDPILLTVRSPWVEAYIFPFVALAAIGFPVVMMVVFGYLPPPYFAIPITAILCELLIWLYCHVNKLVVTRSEVVRYSGLLGRSTQTIPIQDIASIRLLRTSQLEEHFALDTVQISSTADPNEVIRMIRVEDAPMLQALIERLRERESP